MLLGCYKRSTYSLLCLGVLACLPAFAQTTTPQTFYVDALHPGAQSGTSIAPFRTITGAMSLVVENRGDTVLVRPGRYTERITVKPGTSLIAEAGAFNTYILGNPAVPADLVILERGALLRGFSVGETGGAAIRVPVNGSAEVTNCVAYASEAGVRAEVDSELACINNTFYSNTTGVSVGPGAKLVPLRNNIVAQNGTGIFAGDNAAVTAGYNAFFQNNTDYRGVDPAISDFRSNPLFVNALALNFHLRSVSNLRNAGDPAPTYNDLDGTRNDLGADGGPGGSIDTLAPQITTRTLPAPAIGPAPLAVLFDARGSQDEWGITSWEWDFDASDGISTEGFGSSVPVLYNAEGGYLVTLKVTDNSGIQSTAVYPVTVGTPPAVTVAAAPRSGPAPLTVQFAPTTELGAELTYAWDFNNDGITDSTAQNPTFTYPGNSQSGRYTVMLTATDDRGVATQVQTNITITDGPVAVSRVVNPGEAALLTINNPQSNINGASMDVPVLAINEAAVLTLGGYDYEDLALRPDGDTAALLSAGPSGIAFARPITLQVPLPARITSTDSLNVRYYDPAAQAWFNDGISNIRISGTPGAYTVRFDTTHFTLFALTLPGETPTTPECGCTGTQSKGQPLSAALGDLSLLAITLALLASRRR